MPFVNAKKGASMNCDRLLAREASPKRRARTRFLPLEPLDVRLLLSASITDLGPLAGGNVTGVNSGVVVGTKVVSVSQDEAFLINQSGVTDDLGSLSGFASSDGTGLNASGEIVGYAASSGSLGGDATTEGFLDINGTLTALGTFGGTSSEASGINASGQVVGWADTKSGQDAFLYGAGQLQDLGGLPHATASVATAINDAGGIVGYSSVGNGRGGGGITQNAFLYSQGTFTDLAAPNVSSIAYAINNPGQIVGEWNGAGSNAHAFLWDNGVMTDLGTLPGEAVSLAESINDSGQIVGYATNAGTGGAGSGEPDHAFLDENGVMTDLNSLLPANSGWVLNTATSIDNAGEIVGMGTLNGAVHAYLVRVPVPTPPPTPTPTPTPAPTPTPTPTQPTPTPTPTPTSTVPMTPKPAPPPRPAPKPAAQPKLPSSGLFRTRTSLTTKPKSATIGRRITLTAAVKNLSRARVAPIGSVTFADGKTVLGSVALLDGKARLAISALPVGKNPIRVFYGGMAGFAQSASPKVVENVVEHHSGKPVAPQLTAIPGGGGGAVRNSPLLRRHAVKRAVT
jgi:probable HAF family extracellular repeat protein